MNSNSVTAPRRKAPELKSVESREWGEDKSPAPDYLFLIPTTHYAQLTRPQTAGARRQKHAADHEGDEDGRRGKAPPRAGASGRRASVHEEDDADSGRRGPPRAGLQRPAAHRTSTRRRRRPRTPDPLA